MTPEALATLHARAFAHPRPWSAAEFAALTTSPAVVLLTAGEENAPVPPQGEPSLGVAACPPLRPGWRPPSPGLPRRGDGARADGPTGFLLGRIVADEAEVLTLAVDPASRRRGIGARLVAAFLAEAAARGAGRAFLEVAADNAAARALYAAAGFAEVARRRGYYRDPAGGAVDALVLARDLPTV